MRSFTQYKLYLFAADFHFAAGGIGCVVLSCLPGLTHNTVKSFDPLRVLNTSSSVSGQHSLDPTKKAGSDNRGAILRRSPYRGLIVLHSVDKEAHWG